MKILIIDDERTVHTLLDRLIVKISGVSALHAYDGVEGLAKCVSDKPDIVICDYMMPRLNGYEVLKAIRKSPEMSEMAVLMMTAHNDKDTVLELLKLKPNDFVLKPINLKETMQRISNIVDAIQSNNA